ncbi:MAG: hypothetical protein R2711_19130 [Acidimicrobiales bacterium]
MAGRPEHLDEHPQVMVDFTHLEAASNLAWCAASSVHAVVGATGFGSDLASFRLAFVGSNCLIAPNLPRSGPS